MYSEKAKALRRCKKLRVDGNQCRAWAKVDEDFCSLHSYDHRKKKLPKKGAERAAAAKRRAHKRAQTQRHQMCSCAAYSWKHRAGGGLCLFPDPPRKVYNAGEVQQAERAIERDEVAATSGAVCNCSKFPYSHRLHERVEQQSGDDNLSDLEREIEYQKSKMWNY
jgi:hypothetical protein